MAEHDEDIRPVGSTPISRRSFVGKVAATSAGFAIVPRHVLGKGFEAPSDTLNVACVGVGGQGRSNLINLASQNVVALCDVDWDYAGKALDRLDGDIQGTQRRLDATPDNPLFDREGKPVPPMTPLERSRAQTQVANMTRLKTEHVPRAKRYHDYREMLEREKSIDGVVVATPDHMHALI